jgi:hypothetical protein
MKQQRRDTASVLTYEGGWRVGENEKENNRKRDRKKEREREKGRELPGKST